MQFLHIRFQSQKFLSEIFLSYYKVIKMAGSGLGSGPGLVRCL